MPSSTNPASEHKTIGVFASQVGRAWGTEFITGVTDAAEANNVPPHRRPSRRVRFHDGDDSLHWIDLFKQCGHG